MHDDSTDPGFIAASRTVKTELPEYDFKLTRLTAENAELKRELARRDRQSWPSPDEYKAQVEALNHALEARKQRIAELERERDLAWEDRCNQARAEERDKAES